MKHLRAHLPVVFTLVVAFMGVIGCKELGLYASISGMDKVMHVLGGLAMAWLAMLVFQDDLVRLKPWKQALILVALATLVGVLWEFAEYSSSLLQYRWPALYEYFHAGSLDDSLKDLAADIAGALAFSLWTILKQR